MNPDQMRELGLIFSDAEVLETIDEHTHVMTHKWIAPGVARFITAPRQLVFLRSWRQDDDGTYVILFQSTAHDKAPQAELNGSMWNWNQPVRAEVGSLFPDSDRCVAV